MSGSDLYLLVDGVKGESQDEKYKKQIEIESANWGVVNHGNFHTATGGGASRAQLLDVRISKALDKSGASLAQHCSTGEHLTQVEVIRRRAGGKAAIWCHIEIEKCMVTSYMLDLHGQIPTERLVLHFQKMKLTIYSQDNKGAETGASIMTYDAAAHSKG